MPEYRHTRSVSQTIPNGSNSMAATAAAPRFEGPRSPPNTSHVPCKFFRQGACQAGSACPFSHDIGSATEIVCKYFAKGNCKFGPKCANVHVLPDGRRINYGKNGVTIGAVPIGLAGRPTHSPTSPTGATSTHSKNGSSGHSHTHSTTSALTNSLYRADHPSYSGAFPFEDRHTQHHLGRQPSLDNGLPAIDVPYSHSSSTYGSPRDDDASSRMGLALSPINGGKGLSVLDAPLPASFDSNGISNAARFPAAPWPSSVPSKFGLDTPSASLTNSKDLRTSETLKLLHTSAFGSSEHLTPTAGSPTNLQTGNGGEEYFGKRAMHSSRYARPKMLSSSLPKSGASAVDRDWEPEFAFGDDADENVPENYLPENLQDLLTPAEKARRGSMRGDNDFSIDGITKGSPNGSSPSRWGPVFPRKDEDELSRSARVTASAFGHVGSPLRNSTLAQEMGASAGSPGFSRPGVMRSGSETMSVLSQQLQRSRLDDGASPHLHPSTARGPSSGISAISKDRHIERHVSSGSISSSVTGRFTTPIDEEDPAFVFSMEEEDEASSRARKRASVGLAMAGLTSYASAVTGKAPPTTAKDTRDATAVNGR